MSFTYFYILCRWNYTGYVLWCLAFLAQRSLYETHPYYCLCFLDAHSLCCLVFPCMSQFVRQLLVGNWLFVLGLVQPEYHDHSSPRLLVNGCTYSCWVCIGLGVEMLSPSWSKCSDWKDTGKSFSKTVYTPTCLSQPAREKEGRMAVVWVETIKFCHCRLEPTYCETWLVGCRDSGNRHRETTDQVNDRIPTSKVKMLGLPRFEDFSRSPSPDSCANASFPISAFGRSSTKPSSLFLEIAWIFLLSTNISSVLSCQKPLVRYQNSRNWQHMFIAHILILRNVWSN